MSKSVDDYTKELVHCQQLIDANLTRLSRTVTRIQKLRGRENYIWNRIAKLPKEKKHGNNLYK